MRILTADHWKRMGNPAKLGRYRHVPLVVCVGAALTNLYASTIPGDARVALALAVPLAFLVVVVAGYVYGMIPGIAAAVVVALVDASAQVHASTEIDSAQTNPAVLAALYAMQTIVGGLIGHLRGLARRGAHDGSERQRAESRLAELASIDALTGLPNRATLGKRLTLALDADNAASHPVTLIFVDLDRFKDVNDALGHNWGDAMLCEVGARLRALVRDSDVIARLGGDEFAIVLRGRDMTQARTVAERIVGALERPFQLEVQTCVVSASVGIAFADPGTDAAVLLRQADIAMYAAKRGRSGIAVYSDDENVRAAERLAITSDLHAAIAGSDFVLHYQPQVDVSSRKVIGVEALIRWNHPVRGLLFPDAFISVAEEIGVMGRLTEWVLRTALAQLAAWHATGLRPRLSVNLSAHDLRDERLGELVGALLRLHALPPERLCLELTESTLASEPARAAERLRALAATGIRISIDDFGTGYASLAMLKALPVDELKIDKQFVIGMADDPDDAAIVRSTIELAHRLGVDVVVEGVETSANLHAIARLGAEYAQGYAISRALPQNEIEPWLRARPSGFAESA